jgi:hypothetical protein
VTLPPLIGGDELRTRLALIFPEGTPDRGYVTRDMAVKTAFVMVYVGTVEGQSRWLTPKHIYSMSDAQAALTNPDEREAYYVDVTKQGKAKYASPGPPWYANNTREPIRDETLREGLISLNAVVERSDISKNANKGRYALRREFAELLNPGLTGDALTSAITRWQDAHLTTEARSRVRIASAFGNTNTVTVHLPQGGTRSMDPGASAAITKAVAEVFSRHFLKRPVVLWISESGEKVAISDEKFIRGLNLNIEAQAVLPDMILADYGEPFRLVFVEVVATSGPIIESRKQALTAIALQGGYTKESLVFVTAYQDRGLPAFRSTISRLAWGTFAWCSTEPEQLLVMDSGKGNLRLALDGSKSIP